MQGFSLFETLIALAIASILVLSVDFGLNALHHQSERIHQSNQIIFS
ncbi:MAG: prepilin-type N-terminal cleavage/methylation domain-containing protein [Gammaproteobacteria bacterium]|jgi:prepilin-type N-terminal cleavage/methylation domain-containing protein|nr:prepilin-type N-terminal cleavage/methylation domain-containing protein [Gammaproteobacteria bacterium]